jgi:WD40 repeat protein
MLFLVLLLVVQALPVGAKEGTAGLQAAFSPNGRLLAAQFGQSIHLFEAASGRQLSRWHVADGVTSLAFSPNGRLLAAGAYNGRVYLFDITSRRLLRSWRGPRHASGRVSGGYQLGFASDSRIGGTGFSIGRPAADPSFRLWDVTGALVASVPDARRATFSDNGWLVALEQSVGVVLWDARERRVWKKLARMKFPVHPFDDTGDTLLLQDGRGMIHRLDVPSGLIRATATTLPREGHTVGSVNLLHVAQIREETVDLWDVVSGRLLLQVPHPRVWSARFVRRGLLLTTDLFARTRVWDMDSGRNVATISGGVYAGAHEYADFIPSPDGKWLAVVDGGIPSASPTKWGVKLAEIRTGKTLWMKRLD